MKFTWRTEIPALVVLAVMWVLAVVWWPLTPDRVPVHWGLDGRADAWGGRIEGLLLLPGVATALFLVFRVAPILDPGGANYVKFTGAVITLRFAIVAFMAAIYGATLASFRGAQLNMTLFLLPLGGAMCLVIGNLLGKLRPNWFMGVRTPWTLSSKLSWSRTHRAAGWVFIVLGALLVVAGVTRAMWLAWAAAVWMVFGVLALVVYSYVVWKRDPDKVPPAGTAPATEG